MNCDDMIMLLNWYRSTETRLGETSARTMLNAMVRTAAERGGGAHIEREANRQAVGTQTDAEATIPLPPCTDVASGNGKGKGMLFIPPEPARDDRHLLTEREKEVLGYIQQGWSNKRIAIRVSLTEATVKVHMKSILRKIRVANRTQAAIWAFNNPSH